MSTSGTSVNGEYMTPERAIFPHLNSDDEERVLRARIEHLEREKSMRGASSTASYEMNMQNEGYVGGQTQGIHGPLLYAAGSQQQEQNQELHENLADQIKQLNKFVAILKDRFGNELFKAMPPGARVSIAEKFHNPPKNCWDDNDTARHKQLQIYAPDCLTVHYKGSLKPLCSGNLSSNDGHRTENGSASVFAKWPLPFSGTGIFYFEVKNLSKNSVSIGLATKAMPLDQMVGQHPDSYGYRSDGEFWTNDSCWIHSNYKYSRGKTVGCGVNLITRRLIFTLDGHPLDTSDLFICPSVGPLFPCISLGGCGDKITTNFGPTFAFDPANSKLFSIAQQTCWDTNACHGDLEIIGDKNLTVHYKGENIDGWRTIYAVHSTLNTNAPIFYFEIFATKVKSRAFIFIGFAIKQQKKTQLGWPISHGTYAYKNGTLWVNGSAKDGTNANINFGNGNILGCGINLATRRIIFTLDGQRVDDTDYCVPSSADPLFPFVSLFNSDDKIEANFGPNFKFNLDNF